MLAHPVGQLVDAGIGPLAIGFRDLCHGIEQIQIALIRRQCLAECGLDLRVLEVQHLLIGEFG